MAEYKSDIEIAQECEMLPVKDIAAKIGLSEDDIEYYGKYKAKVNCNILKRFIKNITFWQKTYIYLLFLNSFEH